jgi:hypothetical protein
LAAARHLGLPPHGPLDGLGPLADEGLDLLVVEVDQCALGKACRLRPYLAIAHDAAGQDELVAGLAMEAEEIPHALDYEKPPPEIPDLVQTVEEQQGAALREGPVQHGVQRQVDAPFPVVAGDERHQRHVFFCNCIGVGRERQEDGQARPEPEATLRAGGVSQCQELEERALPGPRVS